jgi:hypothetical protein
VCCGADVERAYPAGARDLPDLTALDLKAMIAGCNTSRSSAVQELAEAPTARETIAAAIEDVTDVTEARFRARLRELPDGHLDASRLHRVRLPSIGRRLDDEERRPAGPLRFHLRCADQAPGVDQQPRGPRALGATIAAVFSPICAFDMPWSSGKAVPVGQSKVVTREGTVVPRRGGPAGRVEEATTTGSFIGDDQLGVCFWGASPTVLAASGKTSTATSHGDVDWAGCTSKTCSGSTGRGEFFGAAFPGTRWRADPAPVSFADGLDAGGFLGLALVESSPTSRDYEYS